MFSDGFNQLRKNTYWNNMYLGGGSKSFLFPPLVGEDFSTFLTCASCFKRGWLKLNHQPGHWQDLLFFTRCQRVSLRRMQGSQLVEWNFFGGSGDATWRQDGSFFAHCCGFFGKSSPKKTEVALEMQWSIPNFQLAPNVGSDWSSFRDFCISFWEWNHIETQFQRSSNTAIAGEVQQHRQNSSLAILKKYIQNLLFSWRDGNSNHWTCFPKGTMYI